MTPAPVLSGSTQRSTRAGIHTTALKALAVVTVSLTALASPAHADEFNTVLGAGIGAVAGAVIGQSVGGRNGALIGAGTGGLIGASVAQQRGYRPMEGMPVQPVYTSYPSYPAYSAYPTYSTYPAYRAPAPVYYAPPRVVVVPAPVYAAPQWRPEHRHGYGNDYGRGYEDHYRRGYRDQRDY